MKTQIKKMTVLFLLFLSASLTAEVKLAKIFSNDMILQRDIPAAIWGTADVGEKIEVSFAGQNKETQADKTGSWLLKLDALKSSTEGRTLSARGADGKTVSVENILVGDIWICTGQSNMHGSLKHYAGTGGGPRAGDCKAILDKADEFPHIRLLALAPKSAGTPQTEVEHLAAYNNSWQISKISSAQDFSAIGYMFGQIINQKLDVPIGLIAAARGNTPVQTWMSEKTQVLAQGKASSDSYYNAMIHPIQKMTIKGAIWYQGESNSRSASGAVDYAKLFTTHITRWREEWGQGDFPFIFVQLAGFSEVKKFDADNNWPILRESQTAALSLPNTGMAVATDLGHETNIHPYAKKEVAERLAAEAMRISYGEKTHSNGPMYESVKFDGSKAIVTLKNVGSALRLMPVNLATRKVAADKIRGFVICGKDKKFVHADAQIKGHQVILSHKDINEPVAVRYAWCGFPHANVYNAEGFPLVSFRSDRFAPAGVQTPYVKWAPSSDGVKRVLCFGDSITKGTYIKGKYVGTHNWVTMFDQLSGNKVQTLNGGRSGRKTSDMAGFEQTMNKYRSVDHLIIFLGVNDLRVATDSVLNDCVKNVRTMVESARKRYGQSLGVTMMSSPGLSIGNVSPRFYKLGYNEKEQAMLDKLRVHYKQLAAESSCSYLDLWGVVSKGNYTDGLHPNLDGQKQIADKVWQHFQMLNQ